MRNLENPILHVALKHWELTRDPDKEYISRIKTAKHGHASTDYHCVRVGMTILGDTCQAVYNAGEQTNLPC